MEDEVEAQGCDVPKVTQLVSNKTTKPKLSQVCLISPLFFVSYHSCHNCPGSIPFFFPSPDTQYMPFVTYFFLLLFSYSEYLKYDLNLNLH